MNEALDNIIDDLNEYRAGLIGNGIDQINCVEINIMLNNTLLKYLNTKEIPNQVIPAVPEVGDITPFEIINEEVPTPTPTQVEILKVEVIVPPIFEPETQVSHNNELFAYYKDIDELVLFPDTEKIKKINWSEELKKIIPNIVLTNEELFDIVNTPVFTGIQKYSIDTKQTMVQALENGLNLNKFKLILERSYEQWVKDKSPKEELILTDHQQGVFDGVITKLTEILQIESNGVHQQNVQSTPAKYMVVFEGAAGTGKTTTMSKVLETLNDKGWSMCFCSPTHQALAVIRETLIEADLEFTEDPEEFVMDNSSRGIIIRTLASFLGIKIKRDMETGEESFTTDKRANTFKVDILCIDESSMISKDQILLILKRLRIDFKAILFVGDEPQLPSPSDKNESNGIFTLPYKYSLTQVVRQAEGSKLLELAHIVRRMILSNQTYEAPSKIITPAFNNHNDIFIFNDQSAFINHYLNDSEKGKVISTYTNKITDEYNNYIRNLAITNQIPGTKLDIVCNYNSLIDKDKEDALAYISNWDDFKEYYPGEQLVIAEANQKNNTMIHQNGELIIVQYANKKTYTIHIESPSENMMEGAQLKEYTLNYWEIIDTKFKTVNVVSPEHQSLYFDILTLLNSETQHRTGKHKWKKYWAFKELFTKVNYTFAATLYKLQGSTYQHMYADLRDLDKFHKWNPTIVYRLLYVALTRPKQKIIILI